MPTSCEVIAQNGFVWKMLTPSSKIIAVLETFSSQISQDPSLTDTNLRKQLLNIPTQNSIVRSTSSSSGGTDAMFSSSILRCDEIRHRNKSFRFSKGQNTEQLEYVEVFGWRVQDVRRYYPNQHKYRSIILSARDVLMADVTYGIVDPRAIGFYTMSFVSEVTASRKFDLLCGRLISTLVNQFEFLSSIYLDLANKTLVFLLVVETLP